jgi:hypothetical protein
VLSGNWQIGSISEERDGKGWFWALGCRSIPTRSEWTAALRASRRGARPVVSRSKPVGRPQARFRARGHSSDTPKRPTAGFARNVRQPGT